MKLKTVALIGVVSVAVLGLIGAGAHAVFTTSTTSGQTITAGTWGAPPTVTITYPVNKAIYGAAWTNAITGTASSNSGAGTTISAVSVAVENTATSSWWNGISFANPGKTFNEANNTTSWNLPLGAGSLTSGDSYEVIAKAIDSLGEVGTSNTVSFTYETAPPSVSISYPLNKTTYGSNWGGELTGSASSNAGPGTSIFSVAVAVEDTTTDKWWNGISFSQLKQVFATASGTTNWSLTLPASALTSGNSYAAVAQATDSLGNVGTSDTVNFSIATASPAVSITYPVNGVTYGANWATAVTGTAAANAPGASITSVQVSVQQLGGACWTGSGDTYTASCPNFVASTSGTTSWSLTLPKSDLTSGETFKVTAQTTDSYGNTGTSSTVTFTYNSAPPTVTISYPSSGSNVCACSYSGKVTGTASSNSGGGTGITSVAVAIENTTTSKWWNGIGFVSTSKTFVEATGTTSWSLPLGASSLTTGDAYSVVAEATDSIGNLGTSSTTTFTYCLKTSPPSVAVSYPVNGTTYGSNWSGEITGSATATAGATITTVSVAIEDLTTKYWWNGSAFSSSTETFNKATGTKTWLYELSSSSLTSGHSYAVIAEATDNLGNTGTSSTVSFAYLLKTVPPTVTITYPVDGLTYGANWTATVTGTAAVQSTGATISTVQLSIQQGSKCWTGAADTYTSTCPNYLAVTTGTASWTMSVPTGDLTSGSSYKVTARATDSYGNLGISSTISFTYDTAPQTVAITYPVNKATYGTNWTGSITGTASSNAGTATSITGVAVAVENATTSMWWNGTSFNSGSPSFQTASGTMSWSLGFATSKLISGDSYNVVAEATDSAGNLGTSPAVSFAYNSAPPTVAITFPVNNASYGNTWTGTISGTAASNAGVGTTITGAAVAIEDTSTKRWWNGSSFSSTTESFVGASGTTTWTLGLVGKWLDSGDNYSVVADATDSLGNTGTSSTVTFTYSNGSHG